MKAITIKQPWAEMIVAGIKDIENRTWRTNFRGRILVHSAKTRVPKSEIIESYPLPAARKAIKELEDGGSIHHTSAIIGSVEIVDCVQNHPSEWAEKGVWNWVLAHPIKYDKPILDVKGQLSIWEYDLLQHKDNPYTYMEFYSSFAKFDERPKDGWYRVMREELTKLSKEEFLNRTVDLIREMPIMAETLDMQYFRNDKGETTAQIWVTPEVSHYLSPEELSSFTDRINKSITNS